MKILFIFHSRFFKNEMKWNEISYKCQNNKKELFGLF